MRRNALFGLIVIAVWIVLLPVAAQSPAPTVTPQFATYTVQKGDTLYRIATRFGTTAAQLAALNGLPNANAIYVGQVLRLPTGAVPVGILTPPISQNESATPTETALPTTEITPEPPAQPSALPTNTDTPVPATSTPLNMGAFSFGVTLDSFDEKALPALAALGASWVRLDVQWKQIERVRGIRDYALLDRQIDALHGASLKLLLTVWTAPDWARGAQDEDGPPLDFALYSGFVADLAARYRGRATAYEIWSEPNLRRNWNGQPLSAERYTDLLRGAYDAVKSLDPAALVVSAGLSPTGYDDGRNAIDDRAFLRRAFAAGLRTVSDGVGVHPFGWSNPPDATCCQQSSGVTGWYNNRAFYFMDTLADYHQIAKAAGSTAPLWVTAFGWGASEGVAPADSVDALRFGFVRAVDAAAQSRYDARALELARLQGFVGPMFAFSFNACANRADPAAPDFYPCYYALLDSSGTPRPSYNAIKLLLRP